MGNMIAVLLWLATPGLCVETNPLALPSNQSVDVPKVQSAGPVPTDQNPGAEDPSQSVAEALKKSGSNSDVLVQDVASTLTGFIWTEDKQQSGTHFLVSFRNYVFMQIYDQDGVPTYYGGYSGANGWRCDDQKAEDQKIISDWIRNADNAGSAALVYCILKPAACTNNSTSAAVLMGQRDQLMGWMKSWSTQAQSGTTSTEKPPLPKSELERYRALQQITDQATRQAVHDVMQGTGPRHLIWDHYSSKITAVDDSWISRFLNDAAAQVTANFLSKKVPSNTKSANPKIDLPGTVSAPSSDSRAVTAGPSSSSPKTAENTTPAKPYGRDIDQEIYSYLERVPSGPMASYPRSKPNVIIPGITRADGTKVSYTVSLVSWADPATPNATPRDYVKVMRDDGKNAIFALDNFDSQKPEGIFKNFAHEKNTDDFTGKIVVTKDGDKQFVFTMNDKNKKPVSFNAPLTVNQMMAKRSAWAQSLDHMIQIGGRTYYAVPQFVANTAGYAFFEFDTNGNIISRLACVLRQRDAQGNETDIRNKSGDRKVNLGFVGDKYYLLKMTEAEGATIEASPDNKPQDMTAGDAKSTGSSGGSNASPSTASLSPQTGDSGSSKNSLDDFFQNKATQHADVVQKHQDWSFAFYNTAKNDKGEVPDHSFYLIFHDQTGDKAISFPGILVVDGDTWVKHENNEYRVRTTTLAKKTDENDHLIWLDASKANEKGLSSDTGKYYDTATIRLFRIPESEVRPENLKPYDGTTFEPKSVNQVAFVEVTQDANASAKDMDTGTYRVHVKWENWDTKLDEFFRDYGNDKANPFFGAGPNASKLDDAARKRYEDIAEVNRNLVKKFVEREKKADKAGIPADAKEKDWDPLIDIYANWVPGQDKVVEFVSDKSGVPHPCTLIAKDPKTTDNTITLGESSQCGK